MKVLVSVALGLVVASCTPASGDRPVVVDRSGLDSLDAALMRATRARNPEAYAQLHTDSVIFEWPALNTVRSRDGLAALMKGNWSERNDLSLDITVTRRHIGRDHATEFAAYRESWVDSKGQRTNEFGRYVITLVPQKTGGWRIDHFFGFADSTRTGSRAP